MNMPGFSAEASLYKVSAHYYSAGAFNQTVDTIRPQACDRNRLRKCLDECGNPGRDGRDRSFVALCRRHCHVAFDQCPPPPPPPPTKCGAGFCPPGYFCCGSKCYPPGWSCCEGKGACEPGKKCCGNGCCKGSCFFDSVCIRDIFDIFTWRFGGGVSQLARTGSPFIATMNSSVL